ncbi:DUF4199 domain-containing protein [Sediminibacterium roseum]|uniref:DUF4199 domain-containing protein n=1 Tax=Sediminibacterium roseum TaxID=1978412 RepID=A0ABW9ZVT3_9BACT|nr:DUF4199 domain-containing protein [Sediminibacterium roseum]NCI49160.1 DUF4199 domain-containing protein [Sediminibacterium roseum]
MKTPAVKFGVYALLFTLVWTVIEHVLGYNTTNHETGQYARMLGALVYYVLIFVAIYQTRKQQGALSFGQGVKAGMTVAVIYSIGVVIIYSIYGEVINTQFKPTLMEFERAKITATGASQQVIDAHLKMVDMSSGGSVLSYCFLFVLMMGFGLVLSLIGSAIFRRGAAKAQS